VRLAVPGHLLLRRVEATAESRLGEHARGSRRWRPEQNQGPIGALLQSCSVLLCLTLSLSAEGEGLGTLGLHEPKLRELATEAGFSSVRRIPMDNPFNSLYELTR
jgi:hypothetical protein